MTSNTVALRKYNYMNIVCCFFWVTLQLCPTSRHPQPQLHKEITATGMHRAVTGIMNARLDLQGTNASFKLNY